MALQALASPLPRVGGHADAVVVLREAKASATGKVERTSSHGQGGGELGRRRRIMDVEKGRASPAVAAPASTNSVTPGVASGCEP